ncbi:PAK4-inhibitor INKA2-like isoform X1 [Astyanax mexicanus]|uniref:PAK4-inhibitor INKA2 n=1 Tax=Astyanax mexicanus TaxID=7994 RepID=A0A8B9KK28_ASTMX|nr:PAK4-inhibitor INKA2-like isoform X1 [Astyanax mexicanus]
MERVPERKDMDNGLKRLKQELISMREAGDGLQAQMNSMMGALQELKLLQVQTALEQLQISCKTTHQPPTTDFIPQHPPLRATTTASASDTVLTNQLDHIAGTRLKDTQVLEGRLEEHSFTRESSLSEPEPEMEQSLFFTSSPMENHRLALAPHLGGVAKRQELREGQHRGSLCTTSTSFSSFEDESFSSRDSSRDSSHGSSCYSPSVDAGSCYPTSSSSTLEDHRPPFHPATMAELQGLMDTLSREGPSIDSDFSHYDTDDSSDWTSSLMSHSRNRQPLVLGDNVFADLVGNWLDLPELESRLADEEERAGRLAEASGHPLRLSCSQEFCKRLSLTTNIFKKVLRSIRPDRDRLLKERPGWLTPEDEEEELLKRGKKKMKGSKPKGSFYRPFWTKAGRRAWKNRAKPQGDNAEEIRSSKGPVFDYSSAVWV